MKRGLLCALLLLFVTARSSADTFHVTSGFIAMNSASGGSNWSFSGDGFADSGGGEVGICGIETPVGQPITPCGSGGAYILGGSTLLTPTGSQSLGVDGFFSVGGLGPFTPGGSDTFIYIAPVTFSGSILACYPLCPGPPVGFNDYFDLTGDTGYLTMVLTLVDDGFGNSEYEHTSVVYTIGEPVPYATPEPGALYCILFWFAIIAVARKFCNQKV